MPLTTGARLGPYEIVGRVGAGGMGEVWKARDTRLNRTVAIKVLPPDLTTDSAARQRLEREARAVAALSHPHICPLFDIGEQDGTDFLVMEYLDGVTLAARLAHGKLPLDQALQYGIQVADALAAAHKAGIVHRDLKPGNVMITKAGAKLLDFGLAKPHEQAVVNRESQATLEPLTGRGTLLGTLQYMAPEQLEGKEADARTDIFAFGAMVYEMTAGRKAFDAATNASLVGAILRDEPPPISALHPSAPRALDRLVRTCMAKDPDERWQSAGDVKRELVWIRDDQSGSTSDRASHRFVLGRTARISAAAVLLTVLAVVMLSSRRQTPPYPTRLTIPLPDSAVFATVPMAQISPDGRQVAFSVEGNELVSLQSLSAHSAESIRGTEGATSLFWSPDSQQLGFTTQSAVKKLTISNRTVETICEACKPGFGGTWSRNGIIVFPSQDGALLRIPVAGGEPQTLTSPNRSQGETSYIAPYFLPDSQRLLFVIRNADAKRSGLYVGQVGSPERRLVLLGEHPAIYAAPGYLLFTRSGTIVAQPFDVNRLKFSGEMVPLVAPSEYWPTPVHGGDAMFQNWFGTWPSFSASDTGVLTYAVADHPESQFQWMARTGQPLQLVGEPGPYQTFDLAPDDTRLVLSRGEANHASLWTIDLARNVTSRLTFGTSSYYDPRWASNAQWVAANKPVPPPPAILKILPDGGETVVSSTGDVCVLDDVSSDSQYLLCRRQGRELFVLPVGKGRAPALIRKAATGYIDQAQFSPDNRFIAYNGEESGRHEVYVTAFPSRGERWQVSDGGGVQPVWRQDGRELYYLGLAGVLKAVAWQTGERPQFSVPEEVFDTGLATPSPWIEQYAVSADGRRFLILKPRGNTVRNSVGVILNWPTLMQAGRSQ